jgi:hypothetical protein
MALNALLNSLDYYGNTIDVHLLWWGDISLEKEPRVVKFLSELKNKPFGFNVTIVDLRTLFNPSRPYLEPYDRIWCLTFSRWLYSSDLGKLGYTAVLNTGADCMVLDNIMPWFDLVENTDVVVSGHNALGNVNFKSDKYVHTNEVPYADTPCFLDPRKHIDTLYNIYKIGYDYGCADMPAYYYALRDAKAKVVLVPDNLWIRNYYYLDHLHKGMVDNKEYFWSSATMMKISMVHGKYFNREHLDHLLYLWKLENDKKPIEAKKEHMIYVDRSTNNLNVMHDFFKKMCFEYKLRLT